MKGLICGLFTIYQVCCAATDVLLTKEQICIVTGG